MTLDAMKSELKEKFNEYDKQVEESYDNSKIAIANKFENKFYFTSICSFLPWLGITGAISFNMPAVTSSIPVELIPYLTLAGAASIGAIGTSLFYKKMGLNKYNSMSNKELFMEEIKNEIKIEQAINRKLVMDKAMDFLDYPKYIEDDLGEDSESNNKSSLSKRIEKKYEKLDLLSARKVLNKKIADNGKTIKDNMNPLLGSMLGGIIFMGYGDMPFIWSNQLFGYGGNIASVLSPFVVGTIGTGACIIKNNKDREEVLNQFNRDFSYDGDEYIDIEYLIIELAKDEIKLRKSKLFKEDKEEPKIFIKEK